MWLGGGGWRVEGGDGEGGVGRLQWLGGGVLKGGAGRRWVERTLESLPPLIPITTLSNSSNNLVILR